MNDEEMFTYLLKNIKMLPIIDQQNLISEVSRRLHQLRMVPIDDSELDDIYDEIFKM